MTAGTPHRCLGCDDVIVSTHRHHVAFCKCGASAVDGGSHYTRVLFNEEIGPPEPIEAPPPAPQPAGGPPRLPA